MISPYIEIGPLKVHFYGLIIAVAIYLGYLLAKRRAHFYKVPLSLFDNTWLLLPLFFSIVGARIYHVLDFWEFYVQDPQRIFRITSGGLGILGALSGFTIGLFIFAKMKKQSLLTLLDLAAPSLILGQAIGRIGNWINQEGFGPPTNLPWKVFIDPAKRPYIYKDSNYFHPTFFYEAALDFVIFFIILLLTKKLEKTGQLFGLYLVLYSLGRFLVEFLRDDTWQIQGVKVAHLIAVCGVIVGITLLLFQKSRSTV